MPFYYAVLSKTGKCTRFRKKREIEFSSEEILNLKTQHRKTYVFRQLTKPKVAFTLTQV